MFMPVISLNSSPAMCCVVPVPLEATFSLPGLALAWAMNSDTVFAGTEGCTTMTLGTRIRPAIGAMSRMKSKLRVS